MKPNPIRALAAAILPAIASLLLLSSCSIVKRPAGPSSGTIEVQGASAAYYASGAAGEGVLNFQGREYPISIVSVGVGGTGAQSITARGEVFNLTSLAEFPGRYTAKRTGLTIVKGSFKALMDNDKGVQIYLDGDSTGLGSYTGMSSVDINLK